MKNVMVFSCGAIQAVDINFALRGSKEYKVYGASSYDDHGIFIYENYIGNVPYMSEPDFLEKFNAILEKYSIDYIIPLHEDMVLYFQEHRKELKAILVGSCYETALLCRYKSKTYKALEGCDFIPKTYAVDGVDEYPVFVKKDNDQGARHAFLAHDYNELRVYASSPDMIICEYLPGEEVTVDCFTDRHGKLRLVNPRVADRILAGVDVHARRVQNDSEIHSIAEQLNDKISFHGFWFFQIKRDKEGRFKLLEISSRFAGAFGLTRCMDLNLPLLALRDFDGKDIDIDFNDTPIEADKIFIGRYSLPLDYQRVILDGEETLFINNDVDTFFMMFMYQCINKRKEILLISGNAARTKEKLKSAKISDEMVNVVETAEYEDALYISRDENHRKAVRQKYGLMCYHPSTVEALLDWRG